jgi:hypothetical protein
MPWSKTSSISLILLILWKKEPFAGKIKFSLVAGDLPPGIHIESDGKRIYGMAPDADAWIKQLLKYNSWSGVMPAYLM